MNVLVVAESGQGRRRWLDGRHFMNYTRWYPFLLVV